jgi:glycosyltransferase involved in cell wall biosynthesis
LSAVKLKIAFFLPHLADGGVARSSFLLAERFVEHGHDVDILTISPSLSMTLTPNCAVRILDLGAKRSAFSIPALVKYLRDERPFALISAQHFANVSAVIARSLARQHTRLILTERLSIDEALKRDHGIRALVLPHLMRLLYGRADAVVANAGDSADRLGEMLGWTRGRVRTIYNPTFDPSIRLMAEEPVAEGWFSTGEPPVVLSVGRLAPQKDFGSLIRAFVVMKAKLDCRLVIIGDGPERSILEALARELGVADSVELPGHRLNPYSYMSRAAVFVLASRYEGLPNVLIEAQACGVPVLSTDCPTGPREILMDGSAGVLVAVGDVGAMAKQGVRLLTDQAFAQGLADEATAHLFRFHPEACYQAYLEILES